MANDDMKNMQDHYPHRGDQIEAWIKDRRDQFTEEQQPEEYMALDFLLDEYREASDTGTSLDEVVNGERERPERGAPKKKVK